MDVFGFGERTARKDHKWSIKEIKDECTRVILQLIKATTEPA